MSVIEDVDGCIWLTSDGGVIRSCNNSYSVFNFIDGIPNPVFTNNSVYKDNENKLWFGNSKGLVYMNPADIIKRKSYNNRIILSDAVVNGKYFTPDELDDIIEKRQIEVKSHQNSLTLQFTSLSFSNPQINVYEYRLAENNDEWNILSARNEISLYNLTPGIHTLIIRLLGDDTSAITYDIKVKAAKKYVIYILIIFLLIVVVSYFLILRRKRNAESGISIDIVVPKEDEKYKVNRLDEQQCEILLEKLNQYMSTSKPYINPSLRINDLAEALNTSSHSLSYLFNQYLNISYYDYVNEYRIAEFKRIVQNSDSLIYTLDTLADMSGFSSRTSFFRSFKKSTGSTPSEYIKNLNKK